MRRLRSIMVVAVILAGCASSAGPSVPAPSAVASSQGSAIVRPSAVAPSPVASTARATPRPATPTPTQPPGILAKIPTAEGPIGLAADRDSVWVENHRSNFLSRIDPTKDLEVDQFRDASVHCDLTTGAGFVWVAEAAVSQARKVDPATGKVVATIDLADACGVAADAEDLWITSPATGKVVRYDPETLKERASIEVGAMPFALALEPTAVWVAGEADGGTLWRIDPATNKVVASVSVPNPFATGVEVGHGAVWVPARENKVVYRIDPKTSKVVATIQLPSEIGGLGVGPDAIWTSGFGDGKVYKIDPATNEIAGSLDTGQGNLGPPLAAFDSIWVAALDRNVVVRIDPAQVK